MPKKPESKSKQSKTSRKSARKKSRPAWERGLVWGGIALLLLVVVIEAISQQGYSQTLARLHDQVENDAGRPVPLNTVACGWYSSRPVHGKERTTRLKWFSLFKTYSIEVQQEDGGLLTAFSTAGASEVRLGPAPAVAPAPATAPVESTAFKGRQTRPQSTGQAGAPSATFEAKPHRLLAREIVRQAFLMTAQRHFGLAIRDQDVGELPLDGSQFPFQTRMDFSKENRFRMAILKDNKIVWQQTVDAPRNEMMPTLLQRLSEWMKTDFVDVIKADHPQEKPESGRKSDAEPSAFAKQHEFAMNPVLQFAVLRQLEQQIARGDESAKIKSALARSYALLGSLTEYDWTPRSKCMKARALIHAEEAIRTWPEVAETWRTRGFVRALCGLHLPGAQDIKKARQLSAQGAPSWDKAIDAYCRWDEQALAASGSSSGDSLVRYLEYLATELCDGPARQLEAAEALWEQSPDCYRAAVKLSQSAPLGIRRQICSIQPAVFAEGLPDFLRAIPDLPAAALPLVDQSGRADARPKLVKALLESDDSGSPSFQVLGRLIDDIGFIQAWDQLHLERAVLSVDTTPTLEAVQPMLVNHPFFGLLPIFLHDRHQAEAVSRGALNQLESVGMSDAVGRLVESISFLNDFAASAVLQQLGERRDDVAGEVLTSLDEIQSEKDVTYYLSVAAEVCPDCPGYLKSMVWYRWKDVESEAPQLEERFKNRPAFLETLALQYARIDRTDDAIRCYQRMAQIGPGNFQANLAELYLKQGKEKEWYSTLLEFSRTPATGLEQANAARRLAYWHMNRNEWREAKPFAEQAADSYSGWGLNCAADCYEGQKDYKRSEAFHRACSERYESSQLEWYFWCCRTGHGNKSMAKRLAEPKVQKLLKSSAPNELRLCAIFFELDNQWRQAIQIYDHIEERSKGERSGIARALAAYRLGQKDEMVRRLKVEAAHAGSHAEEYFAYGIYQGLLSVPPKAPTDLELQWYSESNVAPGKVTGACYYIGMALQLFNEQERSISWLKKAASAPSDFGFFKTLAGRELTQLKIDPPLRRAAELDASLQPAAKLINEGYALLASEANHEKALENFTAAIALNPDWITVRIPRATLNMTLKNYSAAADDFRETARALPSIPVFHLHLGRALAFAKDFKGAIAALETGLQQEPHDEWLNNRLAWLLIACPDPQFRDPKRAINLVLKSEGDVRDGQCETNQLQAAAYAELGEFDNAVKFQDAAVNSTDARDRFEAQRRLQLYREQKRYQPPTKPATNVPGQFDTRGREDAAAFRNIFEQE